MDKNAIKKYAVWARRELIERVSQRALVYGITAKDAGDPNAESVNGHLLSQAEKRQRQALIRNIKEKGYEQVMEEVAYTWFNRFAALRFMEVNGYLPSHIRVFTNDAGEFKPQILAEAIHLELDGLDMNKVYELESANKSEELFKYLLIVQCNALNSILPGMFQRIEDYTELLLPDYLLRDGSVIEQMVTTIPEEDWTDQVQIIGWLYQYYNTEPKDKVFTDLKKNIKITKENIPAATQLFTPDWIVHYMVENSLGRLWLEGHPNDTLKSEWKYYLDEAEQEPEVQAQLATIRKEYAALKPEEIRVIDPCMGSGHILCVLFDVLVRIYEDYGYTAREAAVKIVENNLWGLDIDERAAQLSYFAVMMKARQYDRRFFTRKVQPHVYAIEESNGITSAPMHDMGLNLSQEEYAEAAKQAMRLVQEMYDAKEYGSIIQVTPCDWNLLRRFAVPREEEGQLQLDIHGEIEASARLQKLINIGETLAQKYHTVVTNPPYMGSRSFSANTADFLQKYYPESRQDLFAVFIQRCASFAKNKYFVSMITMHSFMFLATFEKMRASFLKNNILSLVHLGIKAFDEIGNDVVQTSSFVFRKESLPKYHSVFCRLVDCKDQVLKQTEFLEKKHLSTSSVSNFLRIPGAPIAYWVSESFIHNFEGYKPLDIYITMSALNKTGDNDRFLRNWWEIEISGIGKKWRFYSKGGNFRRYYGNLEDVIDWSESARNFYKTNKTSNLINEEFWYREGITYSAVTSRGTGFRYLPSGCLYDMGGPAIFVSENHLLFVLALLNSSVATHYFNVLNPSINLQTKDIKALPVVMDKVDEIENYSKHCMEIAKWDWDLRETSSDFKGIILSGQRIEGNYEEALSAAQTAYREFYSYLTSINELFAQEYGLLSNELPQIEDRDIAVSIPTSTSWVKGFISYSVGCMFGRFSLDVQGITYAGGEWDAHKYMRFQPDHDTIIPICDDEYFEDDIVGRFVEFVEVVYGKTMLEENLRFIADALGGKGSSREVIRSYFINDFYSDHLKKYQKRPIYWLFDSGKKNSFKCLIYMHRYQPDTIARIRTDYVHEQQSRYRTAIADLEQRINGASTSERVKLSKQLAKLQAQAEEIRIYEEKIHHLADQMIKIDLDDGVKHNYEIFKDVLAKIK